MIGVDTGRENFYPRSPCGERLDKQIAQLTEQAFLSTLSLRRATTQMQAAFKGPEISIHALLAESDGHTHYMGVYEQISIHALLAESDSSACCGVRRKYNFYPRSPCGERPLRYSEQSAPPNISIHALLAESDNRYGRPIDVQFVFLSTLSLRRATSLTTYLDTSSIISIHALLAESDLWVWMGGLSCDISIHALLAESDITLPVLFVKNVLFLSTLSLRRATVLVVPSGCWLPISIHALLAESDRVVTAFWGSVDNFYPRSPCGERQQESTSEEVEIYISIHALLAESDRAHQQR